jgi:hypothetical protein
MHLFASRLIGPLRFLSVPALLRAAWVNLRHRDSGTTPSQTRTPDPARLTPTA